MSNHTHFYGHSLSEFRVDDRVALHPATDLWMRGVRYGTVVKVGKKFVQVRFDAPYGRTLTMQTRDLSIMVK
jgi:hypothetical protein